jgi:hypothetical protein
MRLFRQRTPGNWDEVFTRMAAELNRMKSGQTATPASAKTSLVTAISIEIAPGELIDKITILEIKRERIKDVAKLANVKTELDLLTAARDQAIKPSAKLFELTADLKKANLALWDIEDQIRICERDQDFGPRFVELARSVYHTNDHRSAVKRRINELLGSKLIEEKSYEDYQKAPKR